MFGRRSEGDLMTARRHPVDRGNTRKWSALRLRIGGNLHATINVRRLAREANVTPGAFGKFLWLLRQNAVIAAASGWGGSVNVTLLNANPFPTQLVDNSQRERRANIAARRAVVADLNDDLSPPAERPGDLTVSVNTEDADSLRKLIVFLRGHYPEWIISAKREDVQVIVVEEI